ncbi:hypothetical protein ATY75_02085 [Rhizobium sp. N122]|nr:hypothetical protein ATY75_02085 [Rhizobium sp. N122]
MIRGGAVGETKGKCPQPLRIIGLVGRARNAVSSEAIRNNFPVAASSQAKAKDDVMLKWALIFFVISIVAGFFGFSGVSAATATIARVLFGIALVIFLIFLVLALMAGQAIL